MIDRLKASGQWAQPGHRAGCSHSVVVWRPLGKVQRGEHNGGLLQGQEQEEREKQKLPSAEKSFRFSGFNLHNFREFAASVCYIATLFLNS